jgi:hypothetical protein
MKYKIDEKYIMIDGVEVLCPVKIMRASRRRKASSVQRPRHQKLSRGAWYLRDQGGDE